MTDYNKYTLVQLKDICKNNSIKGYSSKNKKQIIDLILSKNIVTVSNQNEIKNQDEIKNMNDEDITTFNDLYNFLQNHDSYDIFDWLKNNWKGKDKQESLLRLMSYLNLIEKLNKFNVCNGNFNLNTIKPVNNIKDLFYDDKNKPRILKDKGDSSDLTCIDEKNKLLLITTSKNINKQQVDKLDIDKLLIHFKSYESQGYKMILCICIRDKNNFDEMIKNIEKTNQLLKDKLLDNNTIIIDWNDLNEAYHQFKISFKNIKLSDFLNKNKKNIIFKLHQLFSIQKTISLKNLNHKNILWGHIPRSGKSYIMTGTIIKNYELNKSKKNNYLIITTAPNETIDQYLKVLDCFQLKDFNLVYLNGKDKKPVLKDNNIIICSKQFLQNKIDDDDNEKTKNIDWLKKINFDIRFLDESHNGGSTSLAKKTLEYYGNNSTTIQITATYSKPLYNYNIPKECCIFWDLEDIRLCKEINKIDQNNVFINKNKLIMKHGNEIESIINLFSEQNIINEYSKYPDLWILTDELKSDVVKDIIDKTKDNNYGWSTDACFLLKNNGNNTIDEFQNEDENLKIWYRIFGKKDNLGIPDKNYPDKLVFMKRIQNICNNPDINSRHINNMSQPMIILAFLPHNDIDKISNATKKLLIKHNIINDFEIVIINSKACGSNSKKNIEEGRSKALLNNKKGVLVLSGKQCSLGVSIDYCDIVILLNNISSFDLIYQMMFRSMTESLYNFPEGEKNKKCGFVIDLNIHRCIDNTLIEYSNLIKPDLHPKDAIKYMLTEKLLTLNGDHWIESFGNKKSDIDTISNTIYNIYSSNIENALNHFLDKIKFKIISLSKDEQKLFNVLFNNMKLSSKQQKEIKNLIDDFNQSDIKKGIEKLNLNDEEKEDNDREEKEDNDRDGEGDGEGDGEEKINYMDILKHIIPLICLLTIHDIESSFIEMFKMIEDNKYIYNILLDQTKSWWGNNIDSNIINIFKNIYIKYLKDDKEISTTIRTIKELFFKNINNSKQLSILIDKYFIPQDIEKKQNAEVSTPYQLRQDMLNTIPPNFWTSIKKVFEPCSGKGGFLIDIIDKFMIGLKDKIKDEKERYKTIVEQCLYFSDINATNIYINKLLIDPYNEYKLNYNEGNTLDLNINSKWNIDNFDAIIGNPPYQAPREKENKTKGGGGDLLWNKFVKFSLNNISLNGYLLFVHPSGWRKPEGLVEESRSKYKGFYKMMTEDNQMVYLNINNTSEGLKVFGCGTRFDYYLIEKCKRYKNTIINDEDNKEVDINLENIPFLPNKNIDLVFKIISNDIKNNIEVLRPGGDPRRDYIKDEKDKEYQYTMIHSTPNNGVRYKYCNVKKDSDHFNIPKIIFGDSGITKNIIVDDKGIYGCSCHAIGLKLYENQTNLNSILGENIKNALLSKKFKDFLESCNWSNYQIDWRLFTYLKKDFWKQFI